MSLHNHKRNTPELLQALREHHLEADLPSQLSDGFRLGYWRAQDAAQSRIAELEAEVAALLADNTTKVERMAELEAQRRRWEVIAKSRAETIHRLRGAK